MDEFVKTLNDKIRWHETCLDKLAALRNTLMGGEDSMLLDSEHLPTLSRKLPAFVDPRIRQATEGVRPRRKRRTKAEMQAARSMGTQTVQPTGETAKEESNGSTTYSPVSYPSSFSGVGLARLQLAQGLSDAQLAKRCGVTIGKVKSWKIGSNNPSALEYGVLPEDIKESLQEPESQIKDKES